jgi:pimeloyl-ACP methyl ester carboxylesterase
MPRLLVLLWLWAFVAWAPAHAGPSVFASERISVEVRGTGSDVVLIPGLGSSPRVWDGTIAAVPGYRYHLIHVAGFAGKAPGANASGPVMAPVAEEIARYIRESGLDRPAIVGHSLGGSWAMMVAARHPGLASRVMVVDMLPFVGVMFAGPAATVDDVRPVADQFRKTMTTAVAERRRGELEQALAGQIRTKSLLPRVVAELMASEPGVSGQAIFELFVADQRADLGNIRIPLTVLFVAPTEGPVQPETMERYYRLSYASAPQAVLKVIPDARHFIMWDEPDAFHEAFKSFLQGSP